MILRQSDEERDYVVGMGMMIMMRLMDDYLKLIRDECECDSLRFAIIFIANCMLLTCSPSLSVSLSLISLSLFLAWQPDDFLNTKRACLMRRVQLYSSLFAAFVGYAKSRVQLEFNICAI